MTEAKNENNDKLAWLVDKDIEDIKFLMWSVPVGFNRFYRIWFWYIIFNIIFLILLFLTRKSYDKFMYKYIFVGYIF